VPFALSRIIEISDIILLDFYFFYVQVFIYCVDDTLLMFLRYYSLANWLIIIMPVMRKEQLSPVLNLSPGLSLSESRSSTSTDYLQSISFSPPSSISDGKLLIKFWLLEKYLVCFYSCLCFRLCPAKRQSDGHGRCQQCLSSNS